MKNFVLFLICCSVLAVTGCASRTKLTLGPAQIGGEVSAHKAGAFSFTATKNRFGFDLAVVGAYLDYGWTKCPKAINFESSTGDPDVVNSVVGPYGE